MPFLASDVYVMSQALLNDQIGTVFSNQVLQPYLNIALRDLGGLMERANIPVTNAASEVIDLPAGEDTIGDPDSVDDPDLPDGLVEIQAIYQRQNENQDFFMITRYDFLTAFEEQPLTAFIPAWAWMEEIIRFIPANGDLEIKINFIKSAIPDVTNDNEPINIIGALNYLGYRTSALASRYIGENPTRAEVLDREALIEWDQMEGVSTKGRQSISTRRRPFRYKNYGMGY